MLVVILALLGIPLWLLAGALIGALISRRRFSRSPGVFACKVRSPENAWPRLKEHARWVHDVLIVHHGLALVRSSALGVARTEPPHDELQPIRGLGPSPVSIRLHLDDGRTLDLAVPGEARALGFGSFHVST